MTKNLEEYFDLEEIEEETNIPVTRTANSDDNHDIEANEIREKALEAFKEIMEVGKNVNPERSARLFEVAGQFLKTGLDATNSKMEKQIKAAKLKLEAKRLKVDDDTLDAMNHGAEIIADRNALIKQLLENSTSIDVEVDEIDEEETN